MANANTRFACLKMNSRFGTRIQHIIIIDNIFMVNGFFVLQNDKYIFYNYSIHDIRSPLHIWCVPYETVELIRYRHLVYIVPNT